MLSAVSYKKNVGVRIKGESDSKDKEKTRIGMLWKALPVVTLVVGLVAGIVLPILIFNAQFPPDFGVSVTPMQGAVQQGGTSATTVSVDAKNFLVWTYNREVMLRPGPFNTSEQFPGIHVGLSNTVGIPSYTSSLLVAVARNVTPGVYPLVINGIAGDGKERACMYVLRVLPTSLASVTFSNLKNGDTVPISMIVNGTISLPPPEGQYMWLVVNPDNSAGWWPQGGRITPLDGQWGAPVSFGQQEHSGMRFTVATILVNGSDDRYYQEYLNESSRNADYPAIPLLPSSQMLSEITVIRD